MMEADYNWAEEDSSSPAQRLDFEPEMDPGYSILSDNEIGERLQGAVASVVALLSVSQSEGSMLLLRFNWSVEKVNDEWFADEEKVRSSIGVFHKADSITQKALTEQTCGVCFDNSPIQEMSTTPYCSHYFCNGCLEGYFTSAIAEGARCLTLRCAEHKCKAAVGEDLIKSVVSMADWARYSQFKRRSFVESQRGMNWCPAPGCGYAVQLLDSWDVDVQCKCGHRFCGGCVGEIHRPIDCETVVKWNQKTDVDGGSVNWKLANSKPCPKCKRPIQKNQGCNHMTCSPPCGHHFCWTCLGDFANYQHACNSYIKSTDIDSDRASMMRYAHYFERFTTNESSMAKAMAGLTALDESNLEAMLTEKGVLQSLRSRSGSAPASFIPTALSQVVESRRILKWSYAYGYYLLEDESNKTRLFECLQGQAESCLEMLHRLVEVELKAVLSSAPGTFEAKFLEYRLKLVSTTVATKNYFKRLVAALENGLVDAVDTTDPEKVSIHPETSVPRKKAKHRKRDRDMDPGKRRHRDRVPDYAAVNANQLEGGDDPDLNLPNFPVDDNVDDIWQCSHCTLTNQFGTDCEACGLPRHGDY